MDRFFFFLVLFGGGGGALWLAIRDYTKLLITLLMHTGHSNIQYTELINGGYRF